MLYIVATPIGNLKDITLRALEILKSVDLIACEDTRHTKILLEHYGIKTPTTSYYQYNKLSKGRYLIELLKEGKDIALVSDSGTPGILDPGHHIINLALKNNIPITAIPGAVALINALVLSGKPSHRFIFEGFLPPKKESRRNRILALKKQKYTIIFYESPHRILATLRDIQEIFGDIDIGVARELTKKFEEIKRKKVSQIIQELSVHKPRGEFVVII
jgi:16S rRNA (cytidine1402-2'-O)-methyltransferase